MNQDVKIQPTPQEIEAACARSNAFVAAIPASLNEAEDRLPEFLRSMNASSRSKIQKVYAIADELSKVRAPYVACSAGCASCCHMNVSIPWAEAERIGRAIGRKPAPIHRSVERAPTHFAGVPCPFLGSDMKCTIYDDRPLVCRKHASFFADALPCRPEVMNDIKAPTIMFSGLDEGLFVASSEHGHPTLADIRDFFP